MLTNVNNQNVYQENWELLLGHCAVKYRVILSALDPRKYEYLKDYSLDFELAYMTTYIAS